MLMQAALDDEELFAALADEQALKDMLDDPDCRAEVLRALEPELTLWSALQVWLRKPTSIALVTTAAALVVVISVVTLRDNPQQLARVTAPSMQPMITALPAEQPPASAGPAVPARREPAAAARVGSQSGCHSERPRPNPRAGWSFALLLKPCLWNRRPRRLLLLWNCDKQSGFRRSCCIRPPAERRRCVTACHPNR